MTCPNPKCGRALEKECGCCLNCFSTEICAKHIAEIDAMNAADLQQMMDGQIRFPTHDDLFDLEDEGEELEFEPILPLYQKADFR